MTHDITHIDKNARPVQYKFNNYFGGYILDERDEDESMQAPDELDNFMVIKIKRQYFIDDRKMGNFVSEIVDDSDTELFYLYNENIPYSWTDGNTHFNIKTLRSHVIEGSKERYIGLNSQIILYGLLVDRVCSIVFDERKYLQIIPLLKHLSQDNPFTYMNYKSTCLGEWWSVLFTEPSNSINPPESLEIVIEAEDAINKYIQAQNNLLAFNPENARRHIQLFQINASTAIEEYQAKKGRHPDCSCCNYQDHPNKSYNESNIIVEMDAPLSDFEL